LKIYFAESASRLVCKPITVLLLEHFTPEMIAGQREEPGACAFAAAGHSAGSQEIKGEIKGARFEFFLPSANNACPAPLIRPL
jgi:hypothetical protein